MRNGRKKLGLIQLLSFGNTKTEKKKYCTIIACTSWGYWGSNNIATDDVRYQYYPVEIGKLWFIYITLFFF